MTNFEKLYIELLDDKYDKGMKAGESQGRKIGEARGKRIGEENGKRIGIIQVAKEMVKNKMKDSDILKVTHISKQELEELKKKVVV